MKQFIFILLLSISTSSVAQTVATEYYLSKVIKKKYHILHKDTFLIDSFHLNGQIASRAWHEDSIYLFDNKGFIHEKRFFSNKIPNWAQYFLGILHPLTHRYYHLTDGPMDSVCEYENGQLQYHAYYKDTFFFAHRLDAKQSVLFQRLSPTQFYWRTGSEFDYTETQFDTASKKATIYVFEAGQRVKQTVYDYFTFEWNRSHRVQDIRFSPQGKKLAEWRFDSNQLKPFKDNGLCLYGFKNRKNQIVITPRYESVQPIQTLYWNGYIVQQDQYALLDEFGKPVLNQQWSYLTQLEQPDKEQITFFYRQGKTSGIIDLQGNITLNGDYKSIKHHKNNLYKIESNKKWGIANDLGQVIIPPLYEGFYDSYMDLDGDLPNAWVVIDSALENKRNGVKLTLIDTQGHILIPSFWGDIKVISNHLLLVSASRERIFHLQKGWLWDSITVFKENNTDYISLLSPTTHKWGLAKEDSLLLPCQYDTLYKEKSYYHCCKQGKWGLFDPQHKIWLMPLQYDDLQSFTSDSIFTILQKGKWSVVNKYGESVLNQQFDQMGYMVQEMYHSLIYLHFGVQNDTILFYNNESFPMTTTLSEANWGHWLNDRNLFRGNLYNSKSLYYNHLGKIIINSDYENVVWQAPKALYAIATKSNGQQFLIDQTGQKQLLPKGFCIKSISVETHTLIVQDTNSKLYGLISMKGKIILPCQFVAMHEIDNSQVIWAKKQPIPDSVYQNSFSNWYYQYHPIDGIDGGWQAYQPNGKLLIINEFDYAFRWELNCGIGQIGTKQGLWNRQGRMLIPPRYDKIWLDTLSQIFHLFRKGANNTYQVGFANIEGQIIIDANLTNISCFKGDYALVEQHGGLSILNKKGQYIVQPTQNILADSVNWLVKLSLIKGFGGTKDQEFREGSDEERYKNYQQYLNTFPLVLQAKIGNLLLSQLAMSAFLDAKQVPLYRSDAALWIKILQDPVHCSSTTYLPTYHQRILTQMEVEQNKVHLGIEENLYDIKGHSYKLQSFTTYAWEDSNWKAIHLEDFLNLNADNVLILNQLIQNQVSLLKDVEMDCYQSGVYFDNIKNKYFVKKKGVQCFMKGRDGLKQDYQPEKWIPILLTHESLTRFLKSKD